MMRPLGMAVGALLSVILLPLGGFCAENFKVGLVMDKGGRDDKSFNSSAFEGVSKAQKELQIQYKYVEAKDDHSFEQLLRSFAQKDYALIIAVGVGQKEAVQKVAARFPKKNFALIDAQADLPNVRSLLFEEHQGSYLVGAAAALVSQTGKVGFIGGMEIPLIRRFQMGYEAGAKKINPKIQVMTSYVGVTGDAWNNPPKMKELALAQYHAGVDVIYSAAGASGAGLFDAAEEKKKFAIGVDSNQNWIKPGSILTSMLKRVDTAVYEVCSDAQKGKFTGGVYRYGLKNQGVDYAVDQYNQKILHPEIRKKLEELKNQIIAGKIQVPDYYLTQKK